MSDTSITSEVRKFIADKISNGETIVVEWLTHEIVNSKSAIEGEDEPFYRICAYTHVKDVVKRCVGKYDAISPVTDAQLTLDGFEHLQVAYTVNRNDQILLVPVDQCSDAELSERATEYDRMVKGLRGHARELRSYIAARVSQQVAS
jgi:hypothetical protein